MPLALDKAEIIAIFVESILYGFFNITFIATIYILLTRKTPHRTRNIMLIAAAIMWILSTMHLSLDLRRMLDAFYTHRDGPGGPIGYFSIVSHVTHVLKSAVYITQTCVADTLLVYRCHAVCRKKWVTLFLALTVVGSAVSGYGSIYVLVHMNPLEGSIFDTSLAPWITSFNVITTGTNIIATGLIAWEIWSINRRVNYLASANLTPIIVIILESGAIYATSLILLTAFYTTDNNAQFIVLDAITPIIGLVFCVIVIRIQIGLKRRTGSSSFASTVMPAHGASSSRAVGSGGAGIQFHMQPCIVFIMLT